MSREVRRVPVGWRHPVTYNEHWEFQSRPFMGRVRPTSSLHGPTERFVGLMDDYAGRLADWEKEVEDIRARRGHSWRFAVEYHLTGYKGRDDDEAVIHPLYGWTEDGMTETSIPCRDIEHLYEWKLAEVLAEKPSKGGYMPAFDVPEDELGWCLYETVSEGTPCTPIFATAEELIDHLATVGQDYDQEPMRRSAAEALVSQGFSLGSMVAIGGRLLKSDTDADLIAEATA